jgi:flagellar biosynthesis protein
MNPRSPHTAPPERDDDKPSAHAASYARSAYTAPPELNVLRGDPVRPNPQRAAAVLAYRAGDAAPRVVAKGRGLLADAILERARAHGIYVHQSRELLALLMQVDLDSRIPPQLYVAVAELLTWLYRLDASKQTR